MLNSWILQAKFEQAIKKSKNLVEIKNISESGAVCEVFKGPNKEEPEKELLRVGQLVIIDKNDFLSLRNWSEKQMEFEVKIFK